MRTASILLALFLLKSCGGTIVPPAPLPTSVDMNPAKWDILWGSGMPPNPKAATMGWQFDFPSTPGSVHYVQTPLGPLTGKQMLVATFDIVGTNPVFSAQVETGESDPAQVHLFIEKNNLDWNDPFGRWWCIHGFVLDSYNQVVTISCPLTPDNWISVFGQREPVEFSKSLASNGAAGVTFGGSNGYGHGVRVLSGSATFKMLSYYVK